MKYLGKINNDKDLVTKEFVEDYVEQHAGSGSVKSVNEIQPDENGNVEVPIPTVDVNKNYVDTELAKKVDKVSGKGLSTNDYTTEEKNKLAGIASGAEVNVQSDWNITDSSSDAYIKNKPSIPSAVTESTVSEWGFTKNTGNAITANGTATRPVYISATDVATPCTYGFGIDSTGPYIETF